jgi:co-chaperonin GroES (HSP10)
LTKPMAVTLRNEITVKLAELMAAHRDGMTGEDCSDDVNDPGSCGTCDTLVAAIKILSKEAPPPAAIPPDDAYREALAALVAQIDAVHAHPSYLASWTIAEAHGWRYDGPSYGPELNQARAVLCAINRQPRNPTNPQVGAFMFNVESLNLKIHQLPRGNRLLVLPLVKAGSSILIDMEENREQPEKGLVIAVGPGGVGAETGRPITVDSTVGELVAYGKYAGMKWTIRHEVNGSAIDLPVFIMRDTEVLLAQPAETLDLVVHDDDPRKIHEAGMTCEHCQKIDGELGLERLRAIGKGEDPDAPATVEDAIAAERDRASRLIVTE